MTVDIPVRYNWKHVGERHTCII